MKHNIIKFISVFLIFAGFQIGTKASADTPIFDYSDKHKIIVLAKHGDPDALFKLGQAHYYGINSVKNLQVAEQFFVHASLKGNTNATIYLNTIRQLRIQSLDNTTLNNKTITKDVKTETQTNKTQKDLTSSLIVSKNTKERKGSKLDGRVSTSPKKAQKAKQATNRLANSNLDRAKLKKTQQTKVNLQTQRKADKNKPKTDNGSDAVSRVSSVKAVQPYQEVAIKDYAEKVLSTAIVNRPNINDADGYAFLKPVKFVFMLVFAALMVLLFYVFIIRGKRLGLIPVDFDDWEYLTLNPDVRDSGMNPRFHYLRYGKLEGRRYRF